GGVLSGRMRAVPGDPERPDGRGAVLVPLRPPEVELPARGARSAVIDAPGRLHLPRREAGRRVTGRALQCLRIEPAATRIADEAVHQTVFGVALGEHRTGEERDLGDGERSEEHTS